MALLLYLFKVVLVLKYIFFNCYSFKVIGPGTLVPQPGSTEQPDYNEKRIFVYKDNNVLLEGLKQAKTLTNTVEPNSENGLPHQFKNLLDAVSHPKQDKLVKR